ncbi:MAG: ankyrin repeat domain-containing protein [Acidobacteria bacterium]|nr:ankyrin repeat domain-containing protein [Acidobacteriota bacterium]
MKAKTRALVSIVFALSIFLGSVAASGQEQNQKKAQPNDERWQSIFDGKTLNGWKPSAPGFFTIEDGAITGKASREQTKSPVFIVWEGGKVKDFRLRFRCRVDDTMDRADIHFRTQVNGEDLAGGYLANFSGFYRGLREVNEEYRHRPDDLAEKGESNLLKEDGKKVTTHLSGNFDDIFNGNKVQNWTDYEIRAIGGHIVIEIGGNKISELIDQRKEKGPQAGIIAISLDAFGEMRFQIKDIELKVLRSQSEDSETILANNRIATIEAIFKELSSGSAEKALELLKQNPSLVNVRNESKQTPLHVAAAGGHKDVVAWLVANGAELNPVPYKDSTPLHRAKTADVARILIKAGGRLDALDYDENTPLRSAARNKNLEVMKAILESGYRMDLISAIYLGDHELIAKLIQEDPKSVNRLADGSEERKENSYGNWSPLMIAIWQKDLKIVQMLLDAGADVNDKTGSRVISGPPRCGTVTSLTNALTAGSAELVELLLRHGADLEVDCGLQWGGIMNLRQFIEKHRSYYPPEIISLLEKEWPKKN